jgi:hypothetical protein
MTQSAASEMCYPTEKSTMPHVFGAKKATNREDPPFV